MNLTSPMDHLISDFYLYYLVEDVPQRNDADTSQTYLPRQPPAGVMDEVPHRSSDSLSVNNSLQNHQHQQHQHQQHQHQHQHRPTVFQQRPPSHQQPVLLRHPLLPPLGHLPASSHHHEPRHRARSPHDHHAGAPHAENAADPRRARELFRNPVRPAPVLPVWGLQWAAYKLL